MRTTQMFAFAAPIVVLTVLQASAQAKPVHAFYQGRRGPEQSETLSRKVSVGRDGRVSISNVAGDIVVTAGTGDEMTIDAVKRTRGDRDELGRVNIIIDEHPGRVEVRTEHNSTFRGGDRVSVEYMVTVPAGTSLDVFSTSGNARVTGVTGSVRLGTVSGNITAAKTPRVEYVRTVSGNVELADVAQDNSLAITSVSGNIHVDGMKARALDVSTVSGETVLRDATAERMNARSVSGSVEYTGALARNGRYEVNSHSGAVRFGLAGGIGFELSATSFSGSVRSDYPMTIGGQGRPEIRGRRSPGTGIQATFGDGSASLSLRTFSGDIAILKTTNK